MCRFSIRHNILQFNLLKLSFFPRQLYYMPSVDLIERTLHFKPLLVPKNLVKLKFRLRSTLEVLALQHDLTKTTPRFKIIFQWRFFNRWQDKKLTQRCQSDASVSSYRVNWIVHRITTLSSTIIKFQSLLSKVSFPLYPRDFIFNWMPR